MRTEEIIRLIKESKKKTPAKAYIAGDLEGLDSERITFIGGKDFGILLGDRDDVERVLVENAGRSAPPTWRLRPATRPFPLPT